MRFYAVVILFFPYIAYPAIIKVTQAEKQGKKIVIFHDQHRGTLDFIDMKKLDKKQKKPLWHFFNYLAQSPASKIILLEVSKSSAQKLKNLSIAAAQKKSFRKQLGYYLAKGYHQLQGIALSSWDDRAIDNRNVSWMIANTIDVLLRIYQEKYQCKAEETCLAWFDEHAAQDFYDNNSIDSFHQKIRETIRQALSGRKLSAEQKKMGFWQVPQVFIEDYLNEISRYKNKLADTDNPSLKIRFSIAEQEIMRILNNYRNKKVNTINQIIMHELEKAGSLEKFDAMIYQPFSHMSVITGDISLLQKFNEVYPKYDFIIIFAGANHTRVLLDVCKQQGFAVKNYDVLHMSDEKPQKFGNMLMQIIHRDS